jgi:hypothetical protein
MHNLQFIAIKADSPEEACSMVESHTEDYGNENNWMSVCGCVSEDNEVYDTGEGAWTPSTDFPTIKDINEMATGMLTDSIFYDPEKFKKEVTKYLEGKVDLDWDTIRYHSEHMSRVGKLTKIDVLNGDQFCSHEYDKSGVTNLLHYDHGKKKYVVALDTHS